MPLARYFLFVGGALLVLLLISEAYLPKLPVAERTDFDPPVVRIHSERKWPELVVYDTGLATIVPEQVAKAESEVPAMVANVSTDARAREAFAKLQPSPAKQIQSKSKKREQALQHQDKSAKRRAALLARQPRFRSETNIWWTE